MKRALLLGFLLLTALPAILAATLPETVTFIGPKQYFSVIGKGQSQDWRSLPIGDRTIQVGLALLGTPYKNYTLELDSRIEAPSVNMLGMDCWTFFEIALASARVLKEKDQPSTQDMLRMIELDRYRGGRCNGVFTSRLHYLEDWLQDNQRRGLVKDVTPGLPGAQKLNRPMKEMSVAWKSSRQLRANPALIPDIVRVEQQLARQGIWYVPKAKVPAAEKYLRNGDVVCIVTTWPYGYTSHVGLAYRDKKGVLRFMHASKNHGKVVVDSRLSDYLNRYKMHAGIMVARPSDI